MLAVIIYLIGSVLSFIIVYKAVKRNNNTYFPEAILVYEFAILFSWLVVISFITDKIINYDSKD